MMTLILGFPVAMSEHESWTNVKKALSICWCAVLDVCVVALCMV